MRRGRRAQCRTLLIAFVQILGFEHCRAQDAPTTPTQAVRSWAVTFENDLFFKTDHYYTDGVQIATRTHSEHVPAELTSVVCPLLRCGVASRYERGDKVGQLMYTPSRINIATPQPYDRPWAGLLYYANEHEWIEEDEKSRTSFTSEIGVTGPASLAEGTQKAIHRTFDGAEPRGWGNQIGGELALMAMVERRVAVRALSTAKQEGVQANTTSSWRAAAGNLMTFVGIGATVEVGKGISLTSPRNEPIQPKVLKPVLEFKPLQADPEAQPSATVSAGSGAPDTECLFRWLQCKAAASVEGRWMLRNIFLDGRLFGDDPHVKKRPFVADVVLSVTLTFPKTRTTHVGPLFVGLSATHRTPEFRSPKFSVSSQNFAAITVGTAF